MREVEYQSAMSTLSAYYPGFEISEETLKAYWLKFRDIDGAKFAKACSRAVEISDYFPTVARLMKCIDDNITLDGVMAELRSVMKIPVGQSFSRSSLHPATAQILDELGGKFSLMQMSEEQLNYKVRRLYKYAVAGIQNETPQIEKRSGKESITTAMKEIEL